MILDNGSQRSYITTWTKDALSLKPVGEQCLSIAAFGSNGVDTMIREVVRVGVRSKFGPDRELTLCDTSYLRCLDSPTNFCVH